MMQTKYITSGGLAFSEKKDMEKLRRFSLNGWHVKGFKFMGYILEKGESTDYIYSVDCRSLKEGEEEEYFDFFSSAGWLHIASEGNIHLFRAKSGTKPIYSDRDTLIEKYANLSGSMKGLAIPIVFITTLAWMGAMVSSGTWQSVLLVIAVILSVIAIPVAWTVCATYNNKWKAKEKKGLANLATTLPFFLLFLAVILLVFGNGLGSPVHVLVYMVIGAVAVPSVIWGSMSLYHKLNGKKE
ncbi:DUF2812 domain-containing protein [Halalkalibacter kiskunsagensis]|uniref:DUF2812 domain-containing protein n=1 Tax=Halalkalibacter kiskunsagensis TaxID=1548599 RepID=A0ABV6K9Y4_9BACI